MKADFLIEYIRHPQTIGAVAPSSRHLAKGMVRNIDFSDCNVIAEYGAGTGIFTAEVIRNRKKGTKLLVIEQNEYFYRLLCRKFGKCHDVYIIHGSAERLREYMKKYNISSVDYVVSGLPFASLPSRISDRILASTRKILAENGGKFITFQYTIFKKGLFRRFFNIDNTLYEIRNLPPAFVFTMTSR